jgi:transcriptional regulator with XRE-family HTH domain
LTSTPPNRDYHRSPVKSAQQLAHFSSTLCVSENIARIGNSYRRREHFEFSSAQAYFVGTLTRVPTSRSRTDPATAERWARIRATVGGTIRQLRTERGLTVEQLALASGVTRNVLTDVELGRRGLLYERLFDLAEALHVPAGRLYRTSDDPPSPQSVQAVDDVLLPAAPARARPSDTAPTRW